MKTLSFVAAAMAGAALAIAAPAIAQEDQHQTPQQTQPRQQPGQQGQQGQQGRQAMASPRMVLVRMSEVNEQEIALGRLAASKTQDPEVRQYARMLIQDHQASQRKVKTLANQMDVRLPPKSQAQRDIQPQKDRLQRLQGRQFERQFLRLMAQQHQQVLNQLQQAQGRIQNQQLSTAVQQSTPMLQEHRDRANALLQKLQQSTQQGSRQQSSGS